MSKPAYGEFRKATATHKDGSRFTGFVKVQQYQSKDGTFLGFSLDGRFQLFTGIPSEWTVEYEPEPLAQSGGSVLVYILNGEYFGVMENGHWRRFTDGKEYDPKQYLASQFRTVFDNEKRE